MARVRRDCVGKPLGKRWSQGSWYVCTLVCIQLRGPNLFAGQVFVAPKLPTIGIDKTKGDHVRGDILSCLGQWQGQRTERQVKAVLQAT